MPSERIQQHIDRLLGEADEALGRFDWASVGKCAEAVLRLDSSNADAITFLEAAKADIAVDLGKQQPPTTTDKPSTAAKPSESEPTSFANGRLSRAV